MIPCYNEEENIENMLDHLRNVKKEMDEKQNLYFEILIINDGSNDKTKMILEDNNHDFLFTIIHFGDNKGYGYVLTTGFKFAQQMKFQYCISFDLDGQHEPSCINKFVNKVLEGNCDQIVSGSRYKDPSMFWQNPWKDRFLVNTIITGIFKTLGLSITDAFCGMKLHDVDAINALNLKILGYEMPIEMLMKSIQNGYSISEEAVPVIYKNRDEFLEKNREDNFLFQKGEERLEKYLLLINSMLENPLKADLNDIITIFSEYFNNYEEINKDNFEIIQQSIFKKITDLQDS